MAIAILAASSVSMPLPAGASTCSAAHIFTTGETLTGTILNANPSGFVTCFQSIDNNNIGSGGIYGSQIKPTNTSQATFGGQFGYVINPGIASQVPLTIFGATTQTADLFDIFSVSGSTKYLSVSPAGALTTTQAPVFGGPLAVASGGTGSATQNFVDLSSVTNTKPGVLSVTALLNSTYNSYSPVVLGTGGGSVASTVRMVEGQVTCTFSSSNTSAAAAVTFSGNAVSTNNGYVVLLTLSGASGVTGFPGAPLVGSKTTTGFTVTAFQSAVVTGTETFDFIALVD